ncbi:hypothetical protein ABHF33_07205 [Chitinibacter sp. FCG-7]|uniref:Uncharacterized protein n=1 Tax=Chitinibacter mangrovi TaxID=3153927 RepID=A0AAU7FDM4_9NEIS
MTLIPILMGYWIRGKLPEEKQNPLNRWLIKIYRPLLDAVLAKPKTTLVVAMLVFLSRVMASQSSGWRISAAAR